MTAPSEVLDLVERFARHRDAYRSGRYNETQVRREFLDPPFKAHGWDVDNEKGYAEAYKDVVHEDAVKVGGFTKAPDYAFRIGGVRKFFVEAKKPTVDLKDGVFEGSNVDTSILVVRRRATERLATVNRVAIGSHAGRVHQSVVTPKNTVPQDLFFDVPDCAFNTSISVESARLTARVRDHGVPLKSVATVKAGMKVRKQFVSEEAVDGRHQKFLTGTDIIPYTTRWRGLWVCYDKSLESEYTNQAFRDEDIFLASPKLLIRQVMGPDRIYATVDLGQFYVDQTLYVVIPAPEAINPWLLLSIVSSKVMAYYFNHTLADGKRTFPKIKGAQIEQLPIPDCRLSSTGETQDRLHTHAKKMLETCGGKATLRSHHSQTTVDREIARLDRQIDQLVYELYCLTDKEIRIVEEATKR